MMKPSTPTPHHLKSYKLCLLDQFFRLTFVPQVFFYKNNNNTTKITTVIERLKESLCKTLSLFYPLAGRLIADESAVDCNDEGIRFIGARVNCSLGDFLDSPNRVDSVGQFLPPIKTVDDDGSIMKASEMVLVHIQVSVFDCGGIAIGCQWLHKIIDGASWGIFLKNWAAYMADRPDDEVAAVVVPDFETASSLFPPRSWALSTGNRPVTVRPLEGEEHVDGGCIVKAFVFTPKAISSLQSKAKSESVPNPTRIEAITGFVWKHAMAAAASSSTKFHTLGPSVATHSVNMRPRSRPPLSPTIIGNLITHAITYFDGHDQSEKSTLELRVLVAKLREAFSIAKDAEFVNKFQSEEGAEFARQFKQKITDISNDSNIATYYKFTCWSRFDICADFGFGTPVWIAFTGGRVSGLFRNLIPLIDVPGYGIEAWMILKEQEMALLQSDKEFLKFASPSSSISPP